ncbi:MAG: hypothetical protein methR_P0999 [Methyloprofundus sp.]|nr:MAG: hypothetical protein methR_P0999 [Methyloprofundus sp.]
MKCLPYFYYILFLSLSACQVPLPWPAIEEPTPPIEQEPRQLTPSQLEQLMAYSANFTSDYAKEPKNTCAKYKKLHQQGDWFASWVLAYNTPKSGRNTCLKTKEIISILTALETNKQLATELLWFNQYYLQLNKTLKSKSRRIYRLQRIINKNKQQLDDRQLENQQQIEDLQLENQDIKEKLDALKAIETSIHQ